MPKVTIYEVAKEAGVSIATVSNVINGKAVVAPKSEKKVRDAVEKLGYLPDSHAQSLASSLNHTLGILFDGNYSSSYSCQFLKGAQKAALENQFDLQLVSLSAREDALPRLRRKVDGLISLGIFDTLKNIAAGGLPIVYAGERQTWDTLGRNVYGGFSGYRKEALSLLLSRGCRKILYFDGGYMTSEEWREHLERKNRKIIRDCLLRHSLPEEMIRYYCPDHDRTPEIFDTLQSILTEEKIDGILALNDEYYPLLYTIAAGAGLKIPQDLKIIGVIQSTNDGAYFMPPLSAYAVDSYRMGCNAVLKLVGMIRGEESLDSLTYAPYSYIERQSV